MEAEAIRTLIGTILLCVMGAAAVAAILWRNWPKIRDICTDENGSWDLVGGLERHFAQSTAQNETALAPEDGSPDEDLLLRIAQQKGIAMADFHPEDERIREHIIFYGRVQGVGFRYQAMVAAKEYGLTGWAENLSDGTVEMEVQGSAAGIGRMMKYLRSGHWIRIDDMDMENRPLVPGEKGFGVRGY